MPSVGPGILHKKNDSNSIGTDKEKQIFTPQTEFYKKLGVDSAKHGVGLELFLAPPQGYIDVATLSSCAALSGGGIWYYPKYHITKSGDKLLGDVWRCFTRETGTNGLFKVRASRGLNVVNHYGHFYTENNTEIEFGSIDSDKVITTTFAFDDDLYDLSCIQAALLYTTSEGERRIRVMTLGIPSTPTLSSVFKFSDSYAIFNVFARMLATEAWKNPIISLRDKLLERIGGLYRAYQLHCATNSNPNYVTIPEPLRFLPIYSLALVISFSSKNIPKIQNQLTFENLLLKDKTYSIQSVIRCDPRPKNCCVTKSALYANSQIQLLCYAKTLPASP